MGTQFPSYINRRFVLLPSESWTGTIDEEQEGIHCLKYDGVFAVIEMQISVKLAVSAYLTESR